MMGRVGRALIFAELVERARDRWVVVISVLFAMLAIGVSVYGRSAEAEVAALTGPSMVTLASLLVPLVALVLGHDAIVGERERNTLGLMLSLPVGKLEVVVAKFLGRFAALAVAVSIGLGAAALAAGEGQRQVLLQLLGPTLLLGAAFLALGILISSIAARQVTAASLLVATWFLLVFFYDLGLLGLLVVTDGQVSQATVANLVFANPAGLFRIDMMERFAGPEVLENLGLSVELPGAGMRWTLWAMWMAVPVVLSGLLLSFRKVTR